MDPESRDAREARIRSLLERSRGGDQSAFRELVVLHQDRAYGLALRITRSPADAEEVAQDAFLRAWLALGRFRGESSFGTWLYRIVARRALDRLEKLRSRRGREVGRRGGRGPGRAGGGVGTRRSRVGSGGARRRRCGPGGSSGW